MSRITFLIAPEVMQQPHGQELPPLMATFLGVVFTVIPLILIVLGWFFAVCLLFAGLFLAKHRHYTYCLVIAANHLVRKHPCTDGNAGGASMAAKHGGQRLLGCCYMLVFIVALMSILVYGCYRSERQRMAEVERRTGQMRQELFDEVKHGRNNPWVMDAELLSMLADDPECVKNVTSLQFSMSDLSDSRFKRTRDFRQLRGMAFYDCHNTDNVLEAFSGMPTIISVSFEVSEVSDAGIRLLATLPNLKKVEVEQVMPPGEIGLPRKLLPHVELVYWSRAGGKKQLIHDKPSSGGES